MFLIGIPLVIIGLFIEMIIKDEGIGIATEKLRFIFDRFYQADDSATRSKEGTGIGLALTKELVQLSNGVINVKSQLGKGTTFEILLPISNRAEKQTITYTPLKAYSEGSIALQTTISPSEQTSIQTSNRLVLIIEENEDVRF